MYAMAAGPAAAAAIGGWVALAGVIVTLASLVALHVLPSGLSPRRNAVSQYGIGRFRSGYRAATIALGVAGAALAIALTARLGDSADTGVANGGAIASGAIAQLGVLLGVFAIARLIISWFPMDEPGGTRTSRGQLHGLIAVITFVAVTAAALRLGVLLQRHDLWRGLAPASTALGAVMAACLIGMLLARGSTAVRSWFGAVERVFYLAMIGWIAIFAVACIR